MTMYRTAVLSDISTIGNCSGSVNIAVMSAMGVEACLIPTAVLSAQTGFQKYSFIDMSAYLSEFTENVCAVVPDFDAVCVGFMSSTESFKAANKLVESFPGAVLVVDPISGDSGKRFDFMTDEMYSELTKLAHKADIITPNITELCLLTNNDYHMLMTLEQNDLIEKITQICKNYISEYGGIVVVTGIDCGDYIVNVTADSERVTIGKSLRYGGSMSGTGDILTSIVCAAAAKKGDIHSAVALAGEFISEVMKDADTGVDRNFGTPYQSKLSMIVNS